MLSKADKIRMSIYLGMSLGDYAVFTGTKEFENDADIVSAVVKTLDDLDLISDKLQEISLQGNASKVDEIVVKQAHAIALLSMQGRKLVKRLTMLTNIDKWSDCFSSSTEFAPPMYRRGFQ